MESTKQNVLVSPLNWGLGHATRCIPIIKALERNGYTPILASDGIALDFLRKEFPHLTVLELPSAQIEYDKKGNNYKWNMLKQTPKIISSILKEKRIIKKWIKEYNFVGIISANRLGAHNKKVRSVFITHQLNILINNTTWITSKVLQRYIKKFDECWIPDFEKGPNFAGTLGHLENRDFTLKYIGPIGRMGKIKTPIKYDLMVIITGSEPHRENLEKILSEKLLHFKGSVVFIKGKLEDIQIKEQVKNILYYNFLTSEEIEQIINESKIVICRSGYTTVMNLARLGKKAFFIPTPGQYEQEYLARKLKEQCLAPYANQDDFSLDDLNQMDLYQGLKTIESSVSWENLLTIFQSSK